MMTDPIADMLTRIRNASMVRKHEVVVPFSKIKKNIADILHRTGYLSGVSESKEKPACLILTLKYEGGQPAIQHLARISKPGGRRYVKKDEIKSVLNGFGVAIFSTPKGLYTDKEAKKLNIGGELICEVY